MGMSAKVLTFTKATATGNQSVTGVGFQGRAAMFYMIGAAASGTWISTSVAGIGFAAEDSSNNISAGCVSWSAQHNADPTVSCRASADSVIRFNRYDQVLRDEADFVSFDSDGFTINWTTASADTRIIHVLVLGGSSLTDAQVVNFARITTTGNQTVTGAGFTPDAMLCASISNSSVFNNDGGSANFSFGGTDGTDQFLSAVVDADNANTSSVSRGNRSNAIFGALDTSDAWTSLASFSSFNSDGCVINWSVNQGTAGRMVSLFLKGGNYKAGTLSKTSGTTAIDQVLSPVALGWQPTASVHASCWGGTLTGAGTTHGFFSLGASDGVNHAAMAQDSIDSTAAQSIQCIAKTTKSILKVTETSRTSTVAAESGSGFFSNGLDVSWTTNDATTHSMHFMAFGPQDVKDVTNQITNPGFEVNTNGWTGGNGTVTRITSDFNSGVACGKLTVTSVAIIPYFLFGSSSATEARRIPAVAGDIIYGSCWVKAGNAGAVGQEVKMQVRGIDSAGSTAIGPAQVGTGVFLTTGWQQATITTTAMPANTNNIQVLIRAELSGLIVTDEILMDDVDIRVNQPFDVYIDGSGGTYHSWIGNANDSKSVRSKRIFTSDVTIDGIVFATQEGDLVADGIVKATQTLDLTTDALVPFSLSRFRDSFDDNVLTNWTNPIGLANEQSGYLELVPSPGGVTPIIHHTTVSTYGLDLVTFHISGIGNHRGFAGVYSGNEAIGFQFDSLNGFTRAVTLATNSTTYTTLHSIPAVVGPWFRISAYNTFIVFEYSADGIVWTNLYSDVLSVAFDYGNVGIYFMYDIGSNPTWIGPSNFLVESVNLGAPQTSDIIIDGVVFGTETKDVILSGLVSDTIALDLIADSVVKDTFVLDVIADGVVTNTETLDLITSGVVKSEQTLDLINDGIVQVTGSHDLVADAYLIAVITADLIADAVVESTIALDLILDGVVLDTQTLDLTVDGTLLATNWSDLVASAIVLGTNTQDIIIDALVQQTSQLDMVVDGVVQTTIAADVIADGYVRSTITRDVIIDGLVLREQRLDVTVDGTLFVPDNIRDLITDAIVFGTTTLDLPVSGVVKVSDQTLGVSVDGVVVTRIGTLTARARIVNPIVSQPRVAGILTATTQVASLAETNPHVIEEN